MENKKVSNLGTLLFCKNGNKMIMYGMNNKTMPIISETILVATMIHGMN